MFSSKSISRALLLTLALLFILPQWLTAASGESLGQEVCTRRSSLAVAVAVDFGPLQCEDRSPLEGPQSLGRGEPIEHYASHSSCGRWREVLAWSVSINPIIERLTVCVVVLPECQWGFDPSRCIEVIPEQFYPQVREVRGDPVSRSALFSVCRSDTSSRGLRCEYAFQQAVQSLIRVDFCSSCSTCEFACRSCPTELWA